MIRSIFPFIVVGIGAAWRLPPALAVEQTSAADAYKDLQRACNKVIGQFK